MAPHFGSRVVGEDAYDKAVRSEKGGASAFGVRVVGAIATGSGPSEQAKRATEHGPLVVNDAQQSDTKGNPGEGVSIEEIRNILAENPTFWDSLFEAELARESGPRDDALHIFREVEKGIKGAGRQEYLQMIAALLGETQQDAARRADLNAGFLKALKEREERAKENALLADADRVKALKERDENLKVVKESDNASTLSQLPPTETLAQAKQAAGIDDAANAKPSSQTTPTKPEGPIQPETQSAVQPLVPKGEENDEQGTDDGEDDGAEAERPDIENATKADLEAYLGEEEVAKIKGTGADGAVVKADLVRAAKRAAKRRGH